MNTLNTSYDMIVIGGGPAGSTVSTFVSMQGHRVLLVEKEHYPLYKVGESLLPATVHGICPMLGVAQQVKNANFVTKAGGTFLWGKHARPWTFQFGNSSKMTGPTSTAYQVERMKFDAILLENAKAKGVKVIEDCTAKSLVKDGERVVGLEVIDEHGNEVTYSARYLVDASGHQTPFARHAGERVYSRFFQNLALFGYYRGGKRLPAPNSGNIYCVAFEYGWFWYIPLSPTLTSVGAVVDKEFSSKLTKGYEAAMQEFIDACPQIKEFLSKATRVTDGVYGELRVRKDYSYTNTGFSAPGLVLIGDAACFIDPVFSSGVHLATYAGLLAARSINSCLAGEIDEARSFGEFEARYRREYALFYDFLLAFYDANNYEDSEFWRVHKVVNSEEITNPDFISLVAGVGGSGEKLYETSEEFLKAREGIGDLLFPRGSDGELLPENDRGRQDFYSKFLKEIVQVQVQASGGRGRLPEAPLFSEGLIPSSDGLHWTSPVSESQPI
jgi:FAD-dependent halogenase